MGGCGERLRNDIDVSPNFLFRVQRTLLLLTVLLHTWLLGEPAPAGQPVTVCIAGPLLCGDKGISLPLNSRGRSHPTAPRRGVCGSIRSTTRREEKAPLARTPPRASESFTIAIPRAGLTAWGRGASFAGQFQSRRDTRAFSGSGSQGKFRRHERNNTYSSGPLSSRQQAQGQSSSRSSKK